MWETALLVLLFFVVAGDPPPAINEAHYLPHAKNFWQPEWLAGDLFISSAKAHITFYAVFGWLTTLLPLEGAAWVGRFVGWTMLAIGLQRLCWAIFARPYASLAVAVVWVLGIEHGNLAGEWVVGGIEAKVPAYALVLLALERMIAGRWGAVWPLLGAAAAFHVLVGGWSVVAAALPRLLQLRRHRRGGGTGMLSEWPFLLLGGAISLCGLVPALALNWGAEPSEANIAAQLYTYGRIKHHLLPSIFPVAWYVRHGVLIALTVIAATIFWQGAAAEVRRRTAVLLLFCGGAVLIAFGGMVLGTLPAIAPGLAARLLRFYWFRMADAFVPLACGVSVVGCLLFPSPRVGRRAVRAAAALVLAVCGGWLGIEFYDSLRRNIPPACDALYVGMEGTATLEQQHRVYRDWLAVCEWARNETPEGSTFLTPRHQYTFKWYAHRAEVVNWKDVPQDPPAMIEWARRFNRVFPRELRRARPSYRPASLVQMRQEYGARYVIVDRRVHGAPLRLPRVYPTAIQENDTYAVYAIESELGAQE